MHPHIKEHLHYYLFLLAIQIAGLSLFLLSSPDRTLMMSAVLLTSFLYTAVALVHHHMNHTLTSKIVLEYVLIAALGIFLMLFYLK